MKDEYENVKQLIHDTVSLLCRNSLSQENVAVRVQGLIGITVGDSDVFLVHFDEAYHNSNDVSGSEHDKREDVFPTSAAVADPSPKSNRRKRQRVSETTPAVASGETGACETDSDVIFNADEVNGNDVKLDFGQIRNFVGSGYDCNQTDNSQWFKSEDTFIAPDPNTSVNSRECQGGSYTRHGSRGNVLLINMLADENNYVSQPNSYMSDQMTYWQSAAASNDPTMVVHQTASVKCEQTSRPRVKQVVEKFIQNIMNSKLSTWFGRNKNTNINNKGFVACCSAIASEKCWH